MAAPARRTSLAIGVPVAAAVLAVLGVLALASARAGSTDDAFVVLFYAGRLAAHGDFAYGAGEGALDGFTSLLDVLLKAAVLRAGPADPVRAVWWTTTVAYGVALALGASVAARAAGPGRRLPAALAVALCPGLAEGTAYLLETPLYLGLLALAAALLPGPRRGWGLELGAAALGLALVVARPEGAPVAVVLLAARAAPAGRGRWRALAGFGLGLGLYLLWRRITFGHWAPNSYHAKASDQLGRELLDGLGYLGGFATGAGRTGGGRLLGALVGSAVLAALGFALGALRSASIPEAAARRRVAATALAAAAALLATVASGGDAYPGRRLLAPAAWLALLATAQVAGAARRRVRQVATALLLAVAALRVAEVLPGAPRKLAAVPRAPWSVEDFVCERDLATALAALEPPVRVAHRHLQALKAFAPGLEVVDLSGLNHRAIAAAPAAGPVRFGRDGLRWAVEHGVELIHLHHQAATTVELAAHGLQGALADAALADATLGRPHPAGPLAGALLERYRAASLPGVCGPGLYVNLLVRADLAPRLRAAGFTVAD